MEFTSLPDLLMKGGYTILILIICSVLSLKVALEKYVILKILNEKFINDLTQKINSLILKKDFDEAEKILERTDYKWSGIKLKSPLCEVFRFLILNRDRDKTELIESAYIKLDMQVIKLEKGLNILATLGSITPFIGLFGTVVGIIKAFESLAVELSFNYSNVMAGISEALISTAAGLVVAVPSVMFYNHFNKKVKNSLPYLDDAINETVSNIIKMRG